MNCNATIFLRTWTTWFSCLALFATATVVSQDTTPQVKRLQRTIFIYNLAEQVQWPESNSKLEEFRIGVLGQDRTQIDLRSMSQKRSIHGKPVKVMRFDKVKDIDGVQLLYVNSKYNFDIAYILKSIEDKDILLITEDYKYNASMINMVSLSEGFEYEINAQSLIAEGFSYAPSLSTFAVSSAQKWKELYKISEKDLESKTEEGIQNKSTLKRQSKELEAQKSRTAAQNSIIKLAENLAASQQDSIDNLAVWNTLQLQEIEDKVALEKILESRIKEQILLVKVKQREIDSSVLLAEKQAKILDGQQIEIAQKEKVLVSQNLLIDDQRNTNILLLVILGLLVLGGLLLYRSYLNKKRLNQELAESNAEINKQAALLKITNNELEQFAYIASHDLQEPLNSITSLIGILDEEYHEAFDETGQQSLAFIKESSVRMRELINGLLHHARLGLKQSTVAVDCNELLEVIQGDLANSIERSGAQVFVDDLPTVLASKVELRQVFQNLISNAIKFSKQGESPEVTISAIKTTSNINIGSEFWEFSVSDAGIGIPEQYHSRIFNIFQRLHSKEAFEGSGIGLSHVKKIVEAHGGTIWLDSEENEGSTFYFTIPA